MLHTVSQESVLVKADQAAVWLDVCPSVRVCATWDNYQRKLTLRVIEVLPDYLLDGVQV